MIYLINDTHGEEAAYKVQTEEQAQAIEQVDPGARRCSYREYMYMVRFMEQWMG